MLYVFLSTGLINLNKALLNMLSLLEQRISVSNVSQPLTAVGEIEFLRFSVLQEIYIPILALVEVSNKYILAVQLKELHKTKLHREIFHTTLSKIFKGWAWPISELGRICQIVTISRFDNFENFSLIFALIRRSGSSKLARSHRKLQNCQSKFMIFRVSYFLKCHSYKDNMEGY